MKSIPPLARSVGWFVLIAGVFALAYGQAPLYYSNQNQYFLHGLAQTGVGNLHEDWLANTADPTPVFSFLVMVTARWLHEIVFYLWYALLLGVYAMTMLKVFSFLAGPRDSWRLRMVFFAGFLLVHAALGRWASYRLLGLDYPYYFQGGLAGQYVLGPMLQPSAFGVFLLLAVYLFLKDRPYWAAASACLAATFHPTYILSAGLLTLAYLCSVEKGRKTKSALKVAGAALLMIAPVLVYTAVNFGESMPKLYDYAQGLLVDVRIPHHCLPALWCDPLAIGQIVWMILGIFLAPNPQLRRILGYVFVVSALLTIVQVVTGNNSLALLFPWRTSVILVPLATPIILTRLVMLGARWFEKPLATVASGVAIAGLVVAGVVLMVFRQGFQASPDEVALLDFVRDNKAPGDVYLLPVTVPDLKAKTWGSLSSDWKPAADKKTDLRLVPVDLQRFRLTTGAAIFVDFKAVPYKDADVLVWYERLMLTQKFYQHLTEGRLDEIIDDLRKNRITHIVMKADCEMNDPRLIEVYEDMVYRVYQLSEPRP